MIQHCASDTRTKGTQDEVLLVDSGQKAVHLTGAFGERAQNSRIVPKLKNDSLNEDYFLS